MRPASVCGSPSAPITPLMLADSGKSVTKLPLPTRAASIRSLASTRRASSATLRAPLPIGVIEAEIAHGRSRLSEPMVTSTPPCARSTLRLMSLKVQRLPVRASSTVRLPLLSPSSRNSWPSRPVSPISSIQDNSAAKTSRAWRGGAGAASADGAVANAVAGGIPVVAADRAMPPSRCWREASVAAVTGTEAFAIGCLSAPANTVTPPSASMRTAISAPTRLRLSARIWPLNRLLPDTRTSAFGALATIVPSASRTTMSRSRTAVPPLSVRSIWVPPTSTWRLLPKFSSIAAASQGVTMSSWIGPLASRHHSAKIPSITTPPSAAKMMATRRIKPP